MTSLEFSPAFMVLLIAGGISVLALVLSKILLFISNRRSSPNRPMNMYECGFKGDSFGDFKYINQYSSEISIYIVLELAVVWLFVCFAFHIADNDWQGMYFIKILALIILLAFVLVAKTFRH